MMRWCAAIVFAADGVRWVTVAPSRPALVSRVAGYVREQAPGKLWPEVAFRVHQMLRRNALEAAIELYFASVGDRWDTEWLHTEEIELDTGVTEAGGLSEKRDPRVENRIAVTSEIELPRGQAFGIVVLHSARPSGGRKIA
jgi:hypothetical protein